MNITDSRDTLNVATSTTSAKITIKVVKVEKYICTKKPSTTYIRAT